MMQLRSLHGTAASHITRVQMDETTATRQAEEAFESFIVMLWQMALAQDSINGWMRTCEHLYTIRLFMDRMRLSHLAELASDLMALAAGHAELGAAIDVRALAGKSMQTADGMRCL